MSGNSARKSSGKGTSGSCMQSIAIADESVDAMRQLYCRSIRSGAFSLSGLLDRVGILREVLVAYAYQIVKTDLKGVRGDGYGTASHIVIDAIDVAA